MTGAEAGQFAWIVALPIVGFIGFIAVLLLGLGLLKEITR